MNLKSKVSNLAPSDNGQETAAPPEVDTSFHPETFGRPTEAQAGEGPDPCNEESLRLSQDLGAGVGVKKALLSVPVRKPDKSGFVRAHPDEKYRLPTAVVELAADRGKETYLVVSAL